MPDPIHRIYPDWKDTLVYDEGEGRTLRLDCDCVEPYQVAVPSADRWAQQTPIWAQERREIVLDRLRAAKCIICEESEFTRTICAPDDTCRVEIYHETDERGYLMRAIRVIRADGEMLLNLNDAAPDGAIVFPAAGMITLPFRLHDRRHQIGIKVRERTFWFHPTEEPQPLDRLPAMLGETVPRPIASPLIRPRMRSILGSIAMLLICLIFVSAAIWQTIAGHTPRDHWMGALGAIFFGACAAMSVRDLRRWIVRRRT